MNTNPSNPEFAKPPQRSWRRHSIEFKTRVIEQARQAHVSVAAVALANGLNANMLRRWLREASSLSGAGTTRVQAQSAAPQFVQLPMPAPKLALAELPAAVEVQILRAQTRVVINLPLGSSSAAWLREVLA